MTSSDANSGSLSSDTPIERAEQDRLGHASFAKAVSQVIRHAQHPEGFVVAVTGEWGSGKTSAVNIALSHLQDLTDTPQGEKHPELHCLRFNPWWFSSQTDLTASFFNELIGVVGKRIGDEATDALKSLGKTVAGLSSGVELVVGLIPGMPPTVQKLVGEALGNAGGALDTERSLQQTKDIVRKRMREADFRTLVVIDDIDRLTSDEQLQLFKLVKSVADLPGIIYLLVYDEKLVVSALSDRPEFRNGAYLEKIVQAPFEVPQSSHYDLMSWFGEMLNQVVSDAEPSSQEHWHKVLREIIWPLVNTPRRVVRLINGFRVSWAAVGADAELSDLLAIEALRLFDRTTYDLIRTNSDWLSGRSIYAAEKKAKAEKILDTLDAEQSVRTKRALIALFPRFARALEELYFGPDGLNTRADKLISDPDYHHIYFNYGLRAEDWGEADQRRLEESIASDKEADFFDELQRLERRSWGTKVNSMLDGLEALSSRLSEEEAMLVLKGLLRSGDQLLNEKTCDGPMLMGVDAETMLGAVIDRLLQQLSEEKRIECLTDALAGQSSLHTLSEAVMLVAQLAGRHLDDGRNPYSRDPLISASRCEQFERQWAEQYEMTVEDRSFYDRFLGFRLVRRYELWGGSAVKEVITSDWEAGDNLPRIMSLFTATNRSSNRGAYPAVVTDLLKIYVSEQDAEATARILLGSDDLEPNDRASVSRFVEGLENQRRQDRW